MDLLISNLNNMNLDKVNIQDIFNWISKIENNDQQNILYKIFGEYHTHKIYLVDYKKTENNIEIKLLGGLNKKNNVPFRESYQIVINLHSKHFKCNCKDFIYRSDIKNIICKHISFLVFKVAKLFENSDSYFQTKTLSDNQLTTFINIIESNKLWDSNYSLSSVNKEFKDIKNITDIKDDVCPICYEMFSETNEPKAIILKCPECNKSVHENCMNIWLTHQDTCVSCRSSCWSKFSKIF